MMKLSGFGQSDVGQKRDNNEDAVHVDNERGVYIVADGMGGHQGGEVASQLAIDTIARRLTPESIAGADAAALSVAVEDAIREANSAILERADSEPELSKMGCALTMLLCVEDQAVVGHVGDTRLYLRRDDNVAQLTNDHTFVGELVRSGTVPAEQMHRHPHAHVLTRALGAEPELDVDTLTLDPKPGDRFLLCSDGLTAYLEDEAALDEPLRERDLGSIPTSLIRWANDSGGRDNVTVVVVEVTET